MIAQTLLDELEQAHELALDAVWHIADPLALATAIMAVEHRYMAIRAALAYKAMEEWAERAA